MLKHAKTLLTILFLFALSFSLAFYLDKKKMPLPAFLSSLFDNIEAVISESYRSLALDEPNDEQVFDMELTPVQSSWPQTEQKEQKLPVELGSYAVTCTDKINAPAAKNIYTWVDSDGIRNVSDTPRAVNNETSIEVLGKVMLERVSISFSGDVSATALRQEISRRVLKANQFYAEVSPEHLITPVTVNMKLYTDAKAYDAYHRSISNNLAATQGFYRATDNEAVVLVSNEEQGINTAVHEAIHAMNRHWFGTTARWLNEGIAEYAEEKDMTALMRRDWNQYLQSSPINLLTLFEAKEGDWLNPSLRTHFYGTSWAFMAFLIEKRKDALGRFLLQESENGCKTIAVDDIERIYGSSVAGIQNDFDRWRRGLAG